MVSHTYPKEYIDIYAVVINESSKTFIENTTKRLERLLNKKFSDWLVSDFLDFDEFQEKIKSFSLSGRIHMNSIVKRFLSYKNKFITEIYRRYKNKISELYDELNSIASKNKKTEEQLLNNFSYKVARDVLIKHIPEINKIINYTKYRDYLITAWFLLQAPVRLCNLKHLVYIKNDSQLLKNIPDKTKNYISKINGIYHVCYNNYKTCKAIGQINLTIEDNDLIDLLDTYQTKFKIPENEQFFYNNLDLIPRNVEGITIGFAISKTIKRLLNINASLNTIRHSYISEYLTTLRSIDEKRDLSRKMGQSFKMNMQDYYVKVN
jgi:hypothetical protein